MAQQNTAAPPPRRPTPCNRLSGSAALFSFRLRSAMQGRRIVHYRRASALLPLENMSRFHEARFLISVAAPAQFPADVGAEVAFVGRSNSGKSSAINAIVQPRALAPTSKTPRRPPFPNFFYLAPL